MWNGAPDLTPGQQALIYGALGLLMIGSIAVGQYIGGVGSPVAACLPFAVLLATALAFRWFWAARGYPQISRAEALRRRQARPTWQHAFPSAWVATVAGLNAAFLYHKLTPATLMIVPPLFAVAWALAAALLGLFRSAVRD